MQRVIIGLLTAFAVVVLPSFLAAEEGKCPGGHRQGPDPQNIFKRLDANQNKVITPDELPADMPERFKNMLIRADENKDRKLTLDELKKAFKHRGEGPKAKGGPVAPPPGMHGMAGKPGMPGMMPPGMGMPGMHAKAGPREQCPTKGPGKPRAKPGSKAGGQMNPEIAAKAIFIRLDTDKDGKLNLKEFSVGFCRLHKAMTERAKAWQMPMHPGFGKDFAKKGFSKGCMKPGKQMCAKGQMPQHGGKVCVNVEVKKPHHGGKECAKGPNPYFKGMDCQKGPMSQHGGKQFAQHGKHFGGQFAGGECPCCKHCMCCKMGPQQGKGMQHGMNPWQHHGMQFGMNPWQHHGMQFGMNPWQHSFDKKGWGQGKPDGKNFMGPWSQGGNKEWSKKPDAKKPPVNKPKVKKVDGGDDRIDRIEARLTSLERQQEAMLVAIQDQQEAMMVALQKTNELVTAKLASLGRQQEKVRPSWGDAKSEHKAKELAKAKDKQRQKPHEDRDRD